MNKPKALSKTVERGVVVTRYEARAARGHDHLRRWTGCGKNARTHGAVTHFDRPADFRPDGRDTKRGLDHGGRRAESDATETNASDPQVCR